MTLNDQQLMQIAIDEALKGLEVGDQPFGAVLARDGEVIATGRNLEYSTFDPTAHAETMALRNAGTSTKDVELPRGHALRILGALPHVPWRHHGSGREQAGAGRKVQRPAGTVQRLFGGTADRSEQEFQDRLSLTTGVLHEESERFVGEWRAQQHAQ